MDRRLQDKIRRGEATLWDLHRAGLASRSVTTTVIDSDSINIKDKVDKFRRTAFDWALDANNICQVFTYYIEEWDEHDSTLADKHRVQMNLTYSYNIWARHLRERIHGQT